MLASWWGRSGLWTQVLTYKLRSASVLLLPLSQLGERLQAQDIRYKERVPLWEVLRSSCNARNMDMFDLWLGPFLAAVSLSMTVLWRLRRWSPRPVAEAALAAGYEWGTCSLSPKISPVPHRGFYWRKSSRLIYGSPRCWWWRRKKQMKKLKNQKKGPYLIGYKPQWVRVTALEDKLWCSCLSVTPLLGALCTRTSLSKTCSVC